MSSLQFLNEPVVGECGQDRNKSDPLLNHQDEEEPVQSPLEIQEWQDSPSAKYAYKSLYRSLANKQTPSEGSERSSSIKSRRGPLKSWVKHLELSSNESSFNNQLLKDQYQSKSSLSSPGPSSRGLGDSWGSISNTTKKPSADPPLTPSSLRSDSPSRILSFKFSASSNNSGANGAEKSPMLGVAGRSPKALAKKSRRKSMGDLYLGRKFKKKERTEKALIEVEELDEVEVKSRGHSSVQRKRTLFGSNPRILEAEPEIHAHIIDNGKELEGDGSQSAEITQSFVLRSEKEEIIDGETAATSFIKSRSLSENEPKTGLFSSSSKDGLDLEPHPAAPTQGPETFTTRHKFERGTLSAFKRQARNIVERSGDFRHEGNILRIWTDKTHLRSVAQKKGAQRLWHALVSFSRHFKYYFQHPNFRLFICYLVTVCNFLIFAEDPVSHSRKEADIPVVGNVFSFIFTKYPPDWRFRMLKVVMWLLAITCGLVIGKTVIHGMILSRFLRLKMFRNNQGSWMVQFFTVIMSLFLFCHGYNTFLFVGYKHAKAYEVNSKMWFSSSTVMKAAACGTWLGDLITSLIVTDMMLQDSLYPEWKPKLRRYYQSHHAPRIILFWLVSVVSTTVVITIIATDWITWDRLNRDFFATSELSRAFLASFVLVMDLMIVMQDWDFPHFTNTLDVNLPGFHKHTVKFHAVEIEISGKWFNYGIIFLVMLFDLNMWKNQIFYRPEKYGQYTDAQYRVRTVSNETILQTDEPYLWSEEARTQIDPRTMLPYMADDNGMHSRYLGYSMSIKSTAFIPCIMGFISFASLIAFYGRIEGISSTKPNNSKEEGKDHSNIEAVIEPPDKSGMKKRHCERVEV